MLILSAKIREDKGKKVKKLREKGILPAVLYGPKIKNQLLELDLKDFKKIYQEGVAPAVKDLGGTLVKEIKEIRVKALPQDLPHSIKVDIGVLKTFEDEILI